MLFTKTLTVPADTSAAEPASTQITLVPGTIDTVWIEWKSGCAWMVYVKIDHGLHQILPVSTDESLNFDAYVLRSEIRFPLDEPPYTLDLVGWSPGTIFPHTIRFMFEMTAKGREPWKKLWDALAGGILPGRGG